MDVTFFEDVPYFSPEGKALLHHHGGEWKHCGGEHSSP